jgi:hypothetical protein
LILCRSVLTVAAFSASLLLQASAQTPPPQLVEQNNHHALLVDGAPYLILGAQINNSSSWPDILPRVWPALEAMHVNTAAAPVYWEQIEPRPGAFDWTNVDALLDGARAHHLHLILLWFGTWKNGNDHYVPDWVKNDPAHYPRMQNSYGTPLDDLSANAPANMDADRTAFAALMHHLAERDSTEHTVLMIQVENESGGIGSVRDYSPAANKEFAGPVPRELVKALGKKPGTGQNTWADVFPGNADEAFQAWSQARYINTVAAAGKQQFAIPMYCNVWLAYPPAELPERHIPIPGIGYPSGGPVQTMLPLWKIAAPAIDAIGPDMYSDNPAFYLHILDTYARPDNPLWVPETGSSDAYAPFFFAALGRGAIGFSPFGVDWTGWTYPQGSIPEAHAENYALLGPMDRTIAKLNYAGQLQTAIEVAGGIEQQLVFPAGNAKAAESAAEQPVALANATIPLADAGTPATRAADAAGDWLAEVRFGFPQRDGEPAPGSKTHAGRVLIAQLGPDEFLLAGIDASIRFHRPGYLSGIRMQILTAEEGYYTPATTPGAPELWHATRILNGDQTDRGIIFPGDTDRRGATAAAAGLALEHPLVVRIRLGRF